MKNLMITLLFVAVIAGSGCTAKEKTTVIEKSNPIQVEMPKVEIEKPEVPDVKVEIQTPPVDIHVEGQ